MRRDYCELPDHSVIDDYYVTEAHDVVGIVAITPENECIVNAQYKHGIGEVVCEIPAGFIEEGEDPLHAAHRELEEETGYTTTHMHHLATLIASPSSQTNHYYIYFAENAQPTGKKMLDPREEIINERIPLIELEQHIRNGHINVLWSVAAIHLALDFLQKNNHKKI